ncbi:MAG: aminopeptidase [Thermoplasmata archaeon]|nr:aminopeptidase [Thermoplasmata archaeon]
MSDSAESLARTVLRKNLAVGKGESVIIETWPHTLEYARAFVAETRRIGAVPTLLYEDEAAWWDAVGAKNLGSFAKLSKAEKAAVGKADAYVHFFGPGDQARLSSLSEADLNKAFAFNEEWYDTAHKGGLRGTRMSIGLMPDVFAERFGTTGPKLREKLLRAGSVDAAKMARKGAKLRKAIEKGSELRIRHSNGTDLTFRLGVVHARADTGIVDAAAKKRRYGVLANNPTGLLMVGVDKANAVGTLVGNRAVYDTVASKRFAGSKWTFEAGKLTKRSFVEGAKEFEKAFAKGGKGREQLSYFSIGLNPEGKEAAPAEDTEEGAVLLSVGNNTFAGGTNKAKSRGFVMIAGADVEIDGKSIVSGGRIR